MGAMRRVAVVAALTGSAAALASVCPLAAKSRGAPRSTVSEVIVHATGGPFCRGGSVAFSPAGDPDRMRRFFEASGQVSIHYIVGRDGSVVRSVPETEVAFHAIDHNDTSIGIELINGGDGVDPYPAEQIAALSRLLHGIRMRWAIPLGQIKGHEETDHTTFVCGGKNVRRKQDPGPLFPWDRLRLDLLVAEAELIPAAAGAGSTPGPATPRARGRPGPD